MVWLLKGDQKYKILCMSENRPILILFSQFISVKQQT